MNKIPALMCVLAGGFLVSCANQESTHMAGRANKTPGHPGYQMIENHDRAMDGAVEHANRSLGFFVAALKSKKPDTHGFEIKTAFFEGDKAEHLWLTDVKWDGKLFHGRINNKPVDLTNVHLGQRVAVRPQEVSDWMFIKDGKLMGGFTTRVLYHRLSPEEKAQFDKEADFKIE